MRLPVPVDTAGRGDFPGVARTIDPDDRARPGPAGPRIPVRDPVARAAGPRAPDRGRRPGAVSDRDDAKIGTPKSFNCVKGLALAGRKSG